PKDSRRNRSDHHVPEQPLILCNLLRRSSRRILPAESANHQLQPIPEKIKQHRQQRPRVQRHIKRQSRVLPSQQPRKQNQVRRTAHRQKFRQRLHQRQNNRLNQRHPSPFRSSSHCTIASIR